MVDVNAGVSRMQSWRPFATELQSAALEHASPHTWPRPCTRLSASAVVRMPHRASAFAYAMLPVMSARHRRLSKSMELLNFSMRGSVLPVKRPPHSLVELPDSWRTQRPTAAPDTVTAVAARQNQRAPAAILRMMMRQGVRLGRGCEQRQ